MTKIVTPATTAPVRVRAVVLAAGALGAALLVGCHAGASAGVELLHLVGIAEKPLVLSHVADPSRAPDSAAGLINPFAPYSAFHTALGRAVKRTVVPDLALPFQIAPSLALGLSHLAVVTPYQFMQLGDRQKFPVLGVSVDEGGKALRPALLIAPASAAVERIGDLRGAAIAFGPADDARTHHAALALLAENGLKPADLSLSVVPLPGSLRHYPNARAVAQAVLNNSCAGGFVDQAAWEALPERADAAGEPARDRFRVLGETRAMPERLIIASPALDPALRERIASFLLDCGRDNRDCLRPLKLAGFEAPSDEARQAWETLGSGAPPPPEASQPASAP